MDDAKELIYHGIQAEEDVMPKVKYEDIPEDRREKWSSHLATFDGVVSNDQEFEEWLAVWMHNIYSDGDYEAYIKKLPKKYRDSREDFERMLHGDLDYHRSEYRHITEFKKWRVENLDPEIRKLTDMAANAPQYDWQDLYALERQKLLCMRTYFSHSRIADEYGHFEGDIWLDICLSLLEYIEADGAIIPYEKIRKMNIRNVRGLVGQDVIDDYISAKEPRKSGIGLDKEFYGRKIYVRKMERLYHLIRLYKTRDWWE
ncbi:MAG: hypothetical protein E7109_06225 [Bacteroidales bacterium]|nr:hypothetical protein [Bacteroidales bacterium]